MKLTVYLGHQIRRFSFFIQSLRVKIESRDSLSSLTSQLWSGSRNVPLIDYSAYVDEGFAGNSIVYACINKIAATAPAAPIQVQQEEGTRFVKSDHYLNDLFSRPNLNTSSFSFQEELLIYLNLAGECYIYRQVDDNGRTFRLSFFRPDRMTPVVKQVGVQYILSGFVYEDFDGRRYPFLPDEIIHIKYPHPGDETGGLGRGLSPLSSAAILADVDNKSNFFLRDFFENAAVPFGLLNSKNALSNDQISRIRSRIKEQYSGSSNFHELMILDSDATYQRLGLSLDEIAFPDIRRLTETRICAAFDISPILIHLSAGLERSTFNNVREAKTSLWTDKIVPDNARISLALSNALISELDGLTIGHDYTSVSLLQEERTATFSRATSGFQAGWLTKNEARSEAGFPAAEDGSGSKYKEETNENSIN